MFTRNFRQWIIYVLIIGLITSAFPAVSASASTSTPQTILTQLHTDSEETFISPEINTSSKEKVRVIVQLDGEPAAIGKYAAKVGAYSVATTVTESAVQSQQRTFLSKAVREGIDFEVNYQFDTVLNGFEITIPANEIPLLASIPGVKSIQSNSKWYALPIQTSSVTEATYDIIPIKQIGADLAWAEGLTGAGLKVGVIDTGVDYLHPDLANAYKGGYDSFNNDSDPYEEIPLTPDEDPYNVGYTGTSHGTHVAGIIVGRAENTGGSNHKGIAPEAELYVYKVLGRDLEDPTTASGSSAQVIDGIERAVKDGMDVINLSLGSTDEKNTNSPDVVAVNNAILSGVTAIVANGNAGPGYYTLGSPASSQLAVSVGAVSTDSLSYTGTVLTEIVDQASVTDSTYSDLVVMGWKTGQTNFSSLLGPSPYEVEYVELGRVTDYLDKNVNGKVVLISRGDNTFIEKVVYAQSHGAKAAVIFNGNAKDDGEVDLSPFIPGRNDYIDSHLGDNPLFIPVFNMKGTEGRQLAKHLVDHPESKLRMTFSNFNSRTKPGDFLASFSSWGPNHDLDLSIKPDVMAPGVNIMSTFPVYGLTDPTASYDQAYLRSNGTSISTPFVSGAALLLKEKYPDWTPFDIRAALANTASVLRDEDGKFYEVYQQGAGRINIGRALNTPALLQAIEPITILDTNYQPKQVINYNSSASFGVIVPGSTAQKQLQLKNISEQSITYQADIQWRTGHTGIDASLSEKSITLEPNRLANFDLNLNVSNEAVTDKFYEGQVNLTSPGQPDLHLPFVVYVGSQLPDNYLGIQEVKLDHSVIYPQRSSQQTAVLSFKLTATDTNYYSVSVRNLAGEDLGYVAMDMKDLSTNDRFAPGVYNITLNGTYSTEDGMIRHLKDGTYKLVIFATQLDQYGNKVVANNQYIEYVAIHSFRVDHTPDSGSEPGGGGGSGTPGGGTPGGGTPGGGTPGGGTPGGGTSSGGSSSAGKGTTVGPITPKTPNTDADTSNLVNDLAEAVIPQGFAIMPVAAIQSGSAEYASLSDSMLQSALTNIDKEPSALVVKAPVTPDIINRIRITAEQIKQLALLDTDHLIVISTDHGAMAIPLSLLSQAPANADLEIAINKLAENKALKLTGNSIAKHTSFIGSPVEFSAHWISSTSSIPVQVPNHTFIKQSFQIPEDIQPNTAGVLIKVGTTLKPVASLFKTQDNNSTLVTIHYPGTALSVAATRKIEFADISSSWAAQDILALARKGIIDGTSENTFSPTQKITRAEFSALLVRALGLKSSQQDRFNDVPSTSWYAPAVNAAFEAGLVHGTGNGSFAPDAKMTHQEMAVILARVLKLTGTELKPAHPSFKPYTDNDKISAYAKDSVIALSAAGIIGANNGGNENYTFQPNNAVTRETAASALRKLLRQAELIE